MIASDLLAHASSLGVFVIFNRSELVKDRKPIDWLACMVKDYCIEYNIRHVELRMTR